jgi:signal transduction histidine kinase
MKANVPTENATAPPEREDPESVRRQFSTGHRLWYICAVLVMTTLATGCIVTWQLHRNAIISSERELTNLGTALAEQTSRSIQSVDLILQEVQSHAVTLGLRSPEEFHSQLTGDETHQFLTNRLRNLPQAEAIALVDTKGTLINWSRDQAMRPVDFSGRDYFRYLSTHDDPSVFISRPTESYVTGQWVLFIARRINGPDGAFLGLVIGLINTHYLEDFFRTISMLPGQTITVLRRDGTVIAGHPDIANRRGKKLPEQATWYTRVAQGGGFYRSEGYFVGTPQIVTVHPLRDYPLVVDVNMSEQAVLKGWYKDTTLIAVVTIIVALGFTLLFRVIAFQFERQAEQNARLDQAAVALRESQRKSKAYAEMSADWFWEQDADLRFQRDSEIPLTSLPTDVGKTRWEFADPAMDPRRWDVHKADLAARRPFRDFRWERIQTDGKRRYMSTSGDPIFDEAGTFVGYIGTGRDITADVAAAEELRRSKERAEAANDAKSLFLANMSHELRTPLHSIIGFGELIHDQTNGRIGENYVEWAGDILDSGRHLLSVINGVLDLSRIEAGRYDLVDDRVNLAAVVRTCLRTVRLQAEKNQLRFDCRRMDQDVELRADSRALTQVVLNLLTNAVKFTPEGGLVSIYTERAANGDLVLVVADTGIGIDAAVLPTLCEPFTQADGSISRRYGGSGLGLTISQKLVVLHGGTLTIESTLGQGTTVRAAFPANRVMTNSRAGALT